jgi:tRNA pseudouridine55 synthase
MLVGRATRLLPYLAGEPKVYDATIAFGAETDTEDLHGKVIRSAALPERERIIDAIPLLTGTIEHVPSAYSAKRVDGQRAYVLARKGEEFSLAPVTIHVTSWEVRDWREENGRVVSCDARVTSSGGTYVRALARELGRHAGSAAHLTALRRVSSGPFSVADACTLEELRNRTVTVRPALDALPHLPRQVLSAAETAAVVRGIDVAATTPGGHAALINEDHGVLVALAERRDDRWQPRVVMRAVTDEAHA